jgi:hypothetical protein
MLPGPPSLHWPLLAYDCPDIIAHVSSHTAPGNAGSTSGGRSGGGSDGGTDGHGGAGGEGGFRGGAGGGRILAPQSAPEHTQQITSSGMEPPLWLESIFQPAPQYSPCQAHTSSTQRSYHAIAVCPLRSRHRRSCHWLRTRTCWCRRRPATPVVTEVLVMAVVVTALVTVVATTAGRAEVPSVDRNCSDTRGATSAHVCACQQPPSQAHVMGRDGTHSLQSLPRGHAIP